MSDHSARPRMPEWQALLPHWQRVCHIGQAHTHQRVAGQHARSTAYNNVLCQPTMAWMLGFVASASDVDNSRVRRRTILNGQLPIWRGGPPLGPPAQGPC